MSLGPTKTRAKLGLRTLAAAALVAVPVIAHAETNTNRVPGHVNQDVIFLRNIANASFSEMRIGSICMKRPARAEMKVLCDSLTRANASAATSAEAILTNAFQIHYVPAVQSHVNQSLLSMQSGTDLERMVLDLVIQTDAAQWKSSNACAEAGKNADVRSLCANDAQERLQRMAFFVNLRCQWFGVCL